MFEIVTPFVGIIEFTSASFLGFLAATVTLYYALPGPRTRTALLLIASSLVYILMSPRHFVVLFVVTAVAYAAGLVLARSANVNGTPSGVLWLAVSLLLIIGSLLWFKFSGYFVAGFDSMARNIAPEALKSSLRLALPLGMSFWTFQTVAYVVDVYRGRISAERNPFYFWLSVMFFPIVTAGPITKVQTLAAQFRTRHRFDYDQMQSALLLIGRGFFKKLMIADRLSILVGSVFSSPREYTWGANGLTLLIAAVFFSVQLYMDFSGYTDIVRGSARLFGVELPINFRAPYFSRSIQEFWRRWHMTLMDWLKEYVYIPLGGNRAGKVRRFVNVLAVFAISGIWHGSGLTFLVWGLLNGIYQIAGRLLAPVNASVVRLAGLGQGSLAHRVVQTMITFMLVTIAWVFFRAESIGDALYIVSQMFSPNVSVLSDGSLLQLGLPAEELWIAVASAAVVFGAEWLSLRTNPLEVLRARPLAVRWPVYYALILSIVIFGAYGGVYKAIDFLYFKF